MDGEFSSTTLYAAVTCNYGNFPRQLSKYFMGNSTWSFSDWAEKERIHLTAVGHRRRNGQR